MATSDVLQRLPVLSEPRGLQQPISEPRWGSGILSDSVGWNVIGESLSLGVLLHCQLQSCAVIDLCAVGGFCFWLYLLQALECLWPFPWICIVLFLVLGCRLLLLRLCMIMLLLLLLRLWLGCWFAVCERGG